jgi:hypothetical protein
MLFKFKSYFINQSREFVFMWSLIIISHILMLVSSVSLGVACIGGHFIENSLGALTLRPIAVFAVFIYVFTQTLILFLFININKQIKMLVSDNDLKIESPDYMKFKYKLHMHTSLNVLFVIILAILYGAVHTSLMDIDTHYYLFLIIFIHYLYNIFIQFFCFKESIKLIVRVNDMIISKL